MMSYYACIKKK